MADKKKKKTSRNKAASKRRKKPAAKRPPSGKSGKQLARELEDRQDLRAKTGPEHPRQRAGEKEKYQDFFDFAPIGYLDLDSEYAIQDANLTASTMLKLDTSEITGRSLSDLVTPECRDKLSFLTRTLIEKGIPFAADLMMESEGRGPFDARLTGIPVFGPDGVVTGAMLSFSDESEKAEADRALAKEAARWKSNFDAMTDVIMIIDRDHRIQRVNAAACETFGMAPEDLEGKNCYELSHGTKEPPPFCPHLRTLDSGEEHESEFFEPHLGKHFLVTTTPVRNREGKSESSVHVMRDVTERVKEEEELRDHRDRLEELVNARTAEMRDINRELVEEVEERVKAQEELVKSRAGLAEAQRIAHLGNWDWNIITNGLSWSDEIYRIFGLEPQEFGATYDAFLEAVHPEDREEVQDAVGRALESGEHYGIEHRVVRPDGEVRWVHEQGEVFFNGDEPVRMIGTVQDITDRREAEAELIRTMEILESFFSTTHLMTAYMDREFNFIRVNQAYADAGRRPREDFYGLNYFDLYPHEENEPIFRRVVETGEPYVVKAKSFDHPDQPERGKTYWDWSLYPIKGEKGEVEALVLYLLDVTEQERARQAEAEARRILEEQRVLAMSADRLRSLGEMAAGIAHELNQPLSGVRGQAEHLLVAKKLGWHFTPEEVEEKARLIIEQADRMSHVIEHTRMFAREADKMELDLLDVNSSVRSSLTMMGAQLRHRGLKMELDLAQDLPPVMANTYSLEQVVMNLVANARDAICDMDLPEGGMIKLSTGLDADGGDGVVITVEDNGPGIAAECIERVFDPFFTTKGPDRGTGLGLSVVKSIVEEFGGIIRIECPDAGGTRAVIRLPAKKDVE